MTLQYSSDPHSPINTERWALHLGKTMLRYANRGYGCKSAAMSRINSSRARLSRLGREQQGLWVNYREQADFETTVGGIPCGVVISDYTAPRAWRQHTFRGAGPGDCDPPEDEDVDFYIVDRRGYNADWLMDKMTNDDEARIAQECAEHVNSRGGDEE